MLQFVFMIHWLVLCCDWSVDWSRFLIGWCYFQCFNYFFIMVGLLFIYIGPLVPKPLPQACNGLPRLTLPDPEEIPRAFRQFFLDFF